MTIGSLFDGFGISELGPLPEHILEGNDKRIPNWHVVRLPVCDGALMESMNGLGYNNIEKNGILRALNTDVAVRLYINRKYRKSGRGNLIHLVTRKLEDYSHCNLGKYSYLVPEVTIDGELNEEDMRLARQMALAQEIALREGGKPENYFKFASQVTKGIRL